MQQGRRRQPGLGVMLLFYQIFAVIGIDKIPPVTLSLVGLQAAVFLRLFYLPWHRATEVCISAYKVWRKKEYLRLLYGAFEHGDDWHLYYNMLSFAYKGQSLEKRFGSVKFFYLISCFTVLTNIVLVALNIFASKFDPDFENQCAIGFSGVIFALKVLTTYYDSSYSRQFMGIPLIIPAKYAVWAELIYIQLLVPNASFFGHLAGILVGTAYVKGPLKFILDTVYQIITGIYSSSHHPRFTPRAEASGYRDPKFDDYVPSGMSEDEQLRRAMEQSTEEDLLRRAQEESMQQSYRSSNYSVPPYPTTSSSNFPPPAGFVFGDMPSAPPPPGFVPDVEELRSKRQAHFLNY